MNAGERVTIGRPVANYTCYVVDEQMAPVSPGVQGELLIGRPGVARGYLRRPELTAEKFIANPFCSDGADPVLYRSGDAVSVDDAGNLVFHGRIDDQVKIRGFRVELGEIEARLDAMETVAQAAVVLRNDDGLDRLVAFIVPAPGAPFERMGDPRRAVGAAAVLHGPGPLRDRRAVATLVSGKVDRKTLKAAPLAGQERSEEGAGSPRDSVEAGLLAAAQSVFPGQSIPFEADFFADLGGHSLIAADSYPRCARTLRSSASPPGRLRRADAARDGRRLHSPACKIPSSADLSFAAPSFRRRFLCGLAQAAALPFILGLVTIQWLGLFLASVYLLQEDASLLGEIPVLMGVYVATEPRLEGPHRRAEVADHRAHQAGRVSLGLYYFRVWVVQRLIQVTSINQVPAELAPDARLHAPSRGKGRKGRA